MFAADSSQNTVFHNAARNGRLWVLAFFLSVKPPTYRSQGGIPVPGAQGPFPSSGGTTKGNGTGRGGGTDEDGGDGGGGARGATISDAKKTDPAGKKAAGQVVVRGDDGGGGDRPMMSLDPAVASLLHCTDCDGHTPLEWACYSGHAGVARLLVEHGLNPFSTDAGGKNCLHWAASQVRDDLFISGTIRRCIL